MQLNDTHPTLAVPELMRILLDEARLGWDEAWDLTHADARLHEPHACCPKRWRNGRCPGSRCCCRASWRSSTRSTAAFSTRFAPSSRRRRPRRAREPHRGRRRRSKSAWRIWPSSARTAPTAWPRIHSELLKKTVVPDFAAIFPERFNNKTNGVTQRRLLLLANPPLARVITEAIGDGWITDLAQLERLKPLAEDAAFRDALAQGQAGGQRHASAIGSRRRQDRQSIPTRSSIRRSSASTSTSGSS